MFAAKDLSSLNMLGKNLGDAVQTQFRNDLNAVNFEREQTKKAGIKNSLSLFTTAVNDPNLKPEQKQQAKIGTMNSLIELGADPKYIDLVDKTLPDPKPNTYSFHKGENGGRDKIFNVATGEYREVGDPRKVKAELQETGKIKKGPDGILYKEYITVNSFDKSPIEGAQPQMKAWTQARDDKWYEHFAASLEAKDNMEVSKRVRTLLTKTRELERQVEYYDKIQQSPSAGLDPKTASAELIQATKEKFKAAAEANQHDLNMNYQELTDIEKQYGEEMIKNPSAQVDNKGGKATVSSTKAGTGTPPAQAPIDTGNAEFSVADIRSSYGEAVKGKTDQEIIDAYKKMGITIKP